MPEVATTRYHTKFGATREEIGIVSSGYLSVKEKSGKEKSSDGLLFG
jgi:hypothetical protein